MTEMFQQKENPDHEQIKYKAKECFLFSSVR